MPWEQAQALLGRGRCLLALGQTAEGHDAATEAAKIFAVIGAAPALTDANRLLAMLAS